MKKMISLFIVAILLVGIFSGCTSEPETEVGSIEETEGEAVEVMNPYGEDLAITQEFSGKLSAIEDVMIMPELSFPAKVISVKVSLGDKVAKGDVLFTLDDENIRNQIEQSEAAYNIANKNVEKTIEQIEDAKMNLDRIEKLYNEGAVSKQQYEQAQLGASNTTIELLQAQTNQAKVALDQAYSQLKKTVVRAPISGYAVDISLKENEFATSSQPAMRIVNTEKLIVNLSVSEQIINKIEKNQEVAIKVNVSGEEIIKGVITAVSPVPDQRTQIYPVEVEIENKDGLIKAGMFAEIIFNMEESKDALVIPSNAILSKNEKNYVYIVKDNSAEIKEVELGLDNGKLVEILSGLTEEDKVVVRGQDYIEDGDKVRIIRGEE